MAKKEVEIDKPLLNTIAKIMNYLATIAMLTDMICRFTTFGQTSDPFFFLFTFELIGFACLIAAAEAGMYKLLLYVEFLKGRVGKGIYLLLIGLLMFDNN